MTIYDIKRLTQHTAPCYFNRKTMRSFGQTLKMFSVRKQADGRYKIQAPALGFNGQYSQKSVRYFNPKTNQLEFN